MMHCEGYDCKWTSPCGCRACYTSHCVSKHAHTSYDVHNQSAHHQDCNVMKSCYRVNETTRKLCNFRSRCMACVLEHTRDVHNKQDIEIIEHSSQCSKFHPRDTTVVTVYPISRTSEISDVDSDESPEPITRPYVITVM
jgi:hypothetical protein